MTFRFAYPVLLVLVVAVAAWLFFALRRRQATITYSMTSAMARVNPDPFRFIFGCMEEQANPVISAAPLSNE